MKKKRTDPYKDVELTQKEKFMEFSVVFIAAAMILFFFVKTLFL